MLLQSLMNVAKLEGLKDFEYQSLWVPRKFVHLPQTSFHVDKDSRLLNLNFLNPKTKVKITYILMSGLVLYIMN